MKDFYIPLGSDVGDVLAYCAAAYRDRPLAGQRLRAETVASMEAGADEATPADNELIGTMTSSFDFALDADNQAFEMTAQAAMGIVIDLRLLVRDGLFYSRIDAEGSLDESSESTASEEVAASALTARWDQQIDMAYTGMTPEAFEESAHPEYLIERYFEALLDPQVQAGLGQDEPLPHNETGCPLIISLPDLATFAKVSPKSQREQLEQYKDEIRFPANVRLLISRDTGYIHRVEGDFGALQFHMRWRMTYYNHGQPIHVSAPPAAEVNPLLAPEIVTVQEAREVIGALVFIGRHPDGSQESFYVGGQWTPETILRIRPGDQVLVNRWDKDRASPSDWVSITSYRSQGPDAQIWRDENLDQDGDDEELVLLHDQPLVVVKLKAEFHEGSLIVRFTDQRQEEVSFHGDGNSRSPLNLSAIGERLTAYRRQMPDGPELISLRRGDQVVWAQ